MVKITAVIYRHISYTGRTSLVSIDSKIFKFALMCTLHCVSISQRSENDDTHASYVLNKQIVQINVEYTGTHTNARSWLSLILLNPSETHLKIFII